MTSRLPLIGLFVLLVAAATGSGATPASNQEEGPLAPPPDDSTSASTSIKGNRLRLLAGGGVLIQKYLTPQYFPFANLNYRWSPSFTPGKRPVVGATGEIGINLIVPYLKGGLEVRSEQFFFDAHGGFTMGILAGGHSASFAFIPFYGAEGGYMFTFASVRWEIEAGINAPLISSPSLAIPYVTIGVAFF